MMRDKKTVSYILPNIRLDYSDVLTAIRWMREGPTWRVPSRRVEAPSGRRWPWEDRGRGFTFTASTAQSVSSFVHSGPVCP